MKPPDVKFRALLLLLMVFVSIPCLSQENDTTEFHDAAFNRGSIELIDGTELKGLVRYDERTHTVNFESGTESASYFAQGIKAFEFFDEGHGEQRLFYALDYNDPESTEKRFIFEVLRLYPSAGILSKKTDLSAYYRKVNRNRVRGQIATVKIKAYMYETIYFLSAQNLIQPYLSVKQAFKGRSVADNYKVSSKILDNSLVFQFLGEKSEAAKKYATMNGLKFDRKEHLLAILDWAEGH